MCTLFKTFLPHKFLRDSSLAWIEQLESFCLLKSNWCLGFGAFLMSSIAFQARYLYSGLRFALILAKTCPESEAKKEII